MNIITQKDVFSDENQASAPKRRERPMRKRSSTPPPSTPPSNSSPSPTAVSPIPPRDEKAEVIDPAALAEAYTKNHRSEPASANKTVFYQAAKPRQSSSFPHRPTTTNKEETSLPNSRTPAYHTRSTRTPKPTFNPRNPNFPPQQPAGNSYFVNRSTTPVPTSQSKLKIIPLGGLEEIGKNMTALELGNDIFIIDMGFMFPDYDMFGVDYIIPDVSYLVDKKDKIRGVFITHGHLDHTGAIPYLIEKLGFPPLYGTAVTIGMVKQRLEEFNLLGRNKLNVVEADKDVVQLGAFRILPFHLVHSIPGAVGLEIETPNGRIVYATDWKFDYTPAGGRAVDFQTLAQIGARGVDLLFSDSTNAEKPGHSISERVVEQALAGAVEEAEGRIIIAMFATNLNRIQQTLNVAHKNGRKVLIVGRSMQQNVEMAVNIKAISIPPHTLISEREASRFNDNQLLILSTGAQGEDRSALVRMANGEHRAIKIKKGDTVIISASPIPGNEKSVSSVMDVLYKAGAQVIYNKVLDVHTSGHAYAEDLKLFIALMKPRYFMPLHGERSKLIQHSRLAQEVGVNKDNILIGENGLIVEMDPHGTVALTESKVPAGYVMVDGLGVGDVGNIVLRDRQAMAQDGIFVVISVFNNKQKKFVTSPDIISRGFIYMRENEQFVNDVRNEIKRFLQRAMEEKSSDLNQVKNELRDYISKLLYEKTERTPMVIPVIIEV